MLLNIKTGFNGVRQCPREEIVVLVSSLPTLHAKGIPFLFTDRHANLATAQFTSDMALLDRIDWAIPRRRDFTRDPEDPGKFERYQAEALVHEHLPVDALTGIICANDSVTATVKEAASSCGHPLQIITRAGW